MEIEGIGPGPSFLVGSDVMHRESSSTVLLAVGFPASTAKHGMNIVHAGSDTMHCGSVSAVQPTAFWYRLRVSSTLAIPQCHLR